MQVAVWIDSVEHGCCGDRLEPGASATLRIIAAHVTGPDGVRFAESLHQDADGAECVDLVGTVRRIVSVHQGLAVVPGQRAFEVPSGPQRLEESAAVPGSGEGVDFETSYIVELEVADDAVLPVELAHDADADEDDETDDRAERELASSPIGVALTALADQLGTRWGPRIRIERSPTGVGVTVTPAAEGAADLLWTLSRGGIHVFVDRGEWTLPRSAAGVDRLRAMADAVADGKVRYRVEKRRWAEVHLDGTRERRFRHELGIIGDLEGNGPVLMSSSARDALNRGDGHAQPW